ncbi:biopolymer transporter TolR [Vibrio sp. qd031]|uniref:cell envelope integrity protein TolA n=1 Tax=Vibrio sp. qd031 TaxID=1603038 RepID=UPI000A1046C1|nr:cell envelope integrity protein TolA [Vibrio sp. qd031]ORT49507.1 biopolymer transporter TolR [Vibrio sp. qd031]
MKKNNKLTKSLIISFAMHALLVAALIWGTDFNMSPKEPSGQIVQAVVIDPSAIREQAAKIREQRQAASKAEQDRLDKLRKQSEELEKNRKQEEERIRKLQQDKARAEKAAVEADKKRKQQEEQRKVEEEKTRQAEAERKQKEEATRKAEAARLAGIAAAKEAEERAVKERLKAEEAEKARIAKEKEAAEAVKKEQLERERAEKAEQERIAQEKAAAEAAEKAKIEQQRLEQLERERKAQEEALNNIFAGMAEENAANAEAAARARSQRNADELARYSAIYTQLIQSKLRIDDAYRGKQCRVNLKLIPTGADAIVSQVKVISGDNQLCSATRSAISQVSSFPLPTAAEVAKQLTNINLTVVPE